MRFLSGTALLLLSMAAAHAQTTFFGPTPYQQQSDTPAGFATGTMRLETFEDGVAHPELSFTPGISIIGPGGLTDSVDIDDGVLDGSGTNGRSGFGGPPMRINFAAPFPQAAGLVWTDGGFNTAVTFEAFDSSGASLGTHGPFTIGDNSNLGTTDEDRFFGARNASGISAIRITHTSGGLEIDHIQWSVAPSGPEYFSSPIVNSTININDTIGGGATTSILRVSNTGLSGSTLTIDPPSGLSGVLSIFPTTTQDIAAGAFVDYMISCAAVVNTPETQALNLFHNGNGGGSIITRGISADYTVTCTGAGASPAFSSTPAASSTIIINDIIDGVASNSVLTVQNSGEVGSTLNVLAPSGLSGVLSVSPNNVQAIAQGSTGLAYSIACNASSTTAATQTLLLQHDGGAPKVINAKQTSKRGNATESYTVSCRGIAPVTTITAVPTMEAWGKYFLAGILMLLGLGAVFMRRNIS